MSYNYKKAPPMVVSDELKQEPCHVLYNISPQVTTIIQPFVMVRPHASMQRLVQDLPYMFNELEVTAITVYPNFRLVLAQDFGGTVRVLYSGLRAAKSRVMAGTGEEQGRAPPAARFARLPAWPQTMGLNTNRRTSFPGAWVGGATTSSSGSFA
jgi:hypothetical protein